jgi:hypothetical protein
MHKLAAITISLFLTACAGARAAADPPLDPDLGAQIRSATAFDGRLWVVGGRNVLVSFSLNDGARIRHFDAGVIALAKAQGHLWILRSRDTGKFELAEWRQGRFEAAADFAAPAAPPIALAIAEGRPVAISRLAIRLLEGKTAHEVALSKDLASPLPFLGEVTAGAPHVPGVVYVGMSRGEWGGSLVRVDLGAGALQAVRDKSNLYGGTDNEGTNAIAADPSDPGCVIAAEGVVHMGMSSGRVARVCGLTVTTLYTHDGTAMQYGKQIPYREAFFDVVPAADGFWAVSNAALYRFGKSAAPARTALPAVEYWHGLRLTRSLPGVIVLATQFHGAHAVSGITPLVIPLD